MHLKQALCPERIQRLFFVELCVVLCYNQNQGGEIMLSTGYTMELESLINRYTALVVIDVVSLILIFALICLASYLEAGFKKKHNKHKTKRKATLEKEKKRKIIAGQLVAFGLLIVVGVYFFTGDSDLATLRNLKKDFSQNSVAVYEGEANLSSEGLLWRYGVFFDFIVDSRLVSFDKIDGVYWIDMSKTDEGLLEDSGDFYGKITYGENSKYILKVE